VLAANVGGLGLLPKPVPLEYGQEPPSDALFFAVISLFSRAGAAFVMIALPLTAAIVIARRLRRFREPPSPTSAFEPPDDGS